jgi:hypothetical protein
MEMEMGEGKGIFRGRQRLKAVEKGVSKQVSFRSERNEKQEIGKCYACP